MDFAEEVAGWLYNEFIKDIRLGISYEQKLASIKMCGKNELPIRLIALIDDKCVGTVSLVQNDLRGCDYTPWLASLYVDVPYRKQKIGEQLVERVKDITRELGYTELYLRTEHAGNYYRRLGWQYIGSQKDEFGLVPEIFKTRTGDGSMSC